MLKLRSENKEARFSFENEESFEEAVRRVVAKIDAERAVTRAKIARLRYGSPIGAPSTEARP